MADDAIRLANLSCSISGSRPGGNRGITSECKKPEQRTTACSLARSARSLTRGVGFREMKQILIAVLAVLVLAGCSGKKPVPASRLAQPAGKFSFVTPDGWFRTKLPGIDFIIVSTEPDYEASPNIFVEGAPRAGSVSNQVTQMIEGNRDEIRAYAVLQQQEFTTESGLKGVKITARRETKDALPLTLYHYLLQDGDRVISITCSCAEPVKQKYEPIFDAAMKSIQSER